jgi:ComF family protein
VAFQGQVEEWIHRFKYPAPGLAALDPNPGAIARALIRDAAGRLAPRVPELVVPVPLHPRRLRARGFNPAALLAREVATLTHARFAPRLLERMRDTPSQTGLRRAARVRNVAQAFRCRAPVHARIWLVDDVVTTGSTVSEAARSLRRAGAHSVIALATSRTPLAPLHHVSPTLEGPTNRQGIAMARLKRSITLKHRANLGEDVGEVELEEGEELTVLQEWESACLCKNAAGLLFDIPKELVDAD